MSGPRERGGTIGTKPKLGFAERPPRHVSLVPRRPDLHSIGQTAFDNKLLTRLVTGN